MLVTHIFIQAVAELSPQAGIKHLDARRKNDRADIDFCFDLPVVIMDGPDAANRRAGTAGAGIELHAALLIDDRNPRHRLGIVDIDRFSSVQPFIESIEQRPWCSIGYLVDGEIVYRTKRHTGPADLADIDPGLDAFLDHLQRTDVHHFFAGYGAQTAADAIFCFGVGKLFLQTYDLAYTAAPILFSRSGASATLIARNFSGQATRQAPHPVHLAWSITAFCFFSQLIAPCRQAR